MLIIISLGFIKVLKGFQINNKNVYYMFQFPKKGNNN